MNLVKNLLTKMVASNTTFAVAESVTGGRIASAVTAIPGSSAVFMGGIIAYTNLLKIKLLQIDKNIIEEFGEVSSRIAIEMAYAIKTICNSDYGIATTGYAGPTGNEIGRVYIAYADSTHHQILNLKLDNHDREYIQHHTTQEALQLLYTLCK